MRKILVMRFVIKLMLCLALWGVGFGAGLTWGEQHAFDSTIHLVCPRNPPGTTLDVHKFQPPQKPLTLQGLYQKRHHTAPLIPDGTETFKI